jgi:hypothetical protein
VTRHGHGFIANRGGNAVAGHLRLVRNEPLTSSERDDAYALRADVAKAVAPQVTANHLYSYSTKANAELLHAIASNDLAALIAAERRLVAIGGLAQIHANHLEKGTA